MNLPENGIPDADSIGALQIKRVRKVLLDKGHDPFIALYDIGPDQVPVVIAVQVDLSEDKIGTVMGDSRKDDPVIAQEQDSGQVQAFAGLDELLYAGLVDHVLVSRLREFADIEMISTR